MWFGDEGIHNFRDREQLVVIDNEHIAQFIQLLVDQ